MSDLLNRDALLEFAHNHVNGTVDCNDIARFPAVDAEPVRYEHWDENGRCTGCGNHAPFWCMASTYYLSPYCQHCGAKMIQGGAE